MLTKVDRMSMAVSLEVRVPFLDYRIVEFASKIPSKYKMNLFKMKRFLKNSSGEYLPKEILNRHKHGFSSPIDKWFREDLREFALDIFNSSEGMVNKTYVNLMLDSHIKRKANYGNKLFTLLVLVLWQQKNKRIQWKSRALL
jgi:asparagine synthase (glutamine-hydrolysing)